MSASSKKKLRKEQQAAQLTEKQLAAEKEAKKLKVYSIAFVAVILAVVVVALALMGVNGYRNSGITERSNTAMTIGEHQLSAAQLNYFYMDHVNQVFSQYYESYGDYAASAMLMIEGFDPSKPLNEQPYQDQEGVTVADHFAQLAVDSAVAAYTAYDRAIAEGYQLTEEDNTSMEEILHELEHSAEDGGYGSLSKYLKAMYGNGTTMNSFKEYLSVLLLTQRYNQEKYTGITYDKAVLDAHSAENYVDYSSFSYNLFYVKAEDFILCSAKEDDKDHTHTEEELAPAREKAKAAAEALIAAAPADAEALDAAIKELDAYAESESAKSTPVSDILYTNITNKALAKWLSHPIREAGNITMLPNEKTTKDSEGNETSVIESYTIVLFNGRNDNEFRLMNVRHLLKSYENGITDPQTNTTVYSDQSKQEAMAFIAELQKSWVDGGASQEAFIELAKEHSTDPGSASKGGLYEDVYPGQMAANFEQWCYDESRQPGDYGIVETNFGVHLMYFVGQSENTFRNFLIASEMREADYAEWYEEMIASAQYTVNDTSKLSLDIVMLR